MIDSLLAKLADIAEIEFADMVMKCDITEGKQSMRLGITSGHSQITFITALTIM
jgi:hypothetical protein